MHMQSCTCKKFKEKNLIVLACAGESAVVNLPKN